AASFVSMIPPPSSYSPLSLHDALPISGLRRDDRLDRRGRGLDRRCRDRHDRARRRYRRSGAAPERPLALLPDRPLRDRRDRRHIDRKSTRLNSSHLVISYAVICLKKKTIAAIAGSGLDVGRQTVLLVVFNVCFILPLILILGILTFRRETSARIRAA